MRTLESLLRDAVGTDNETQLRQARQLLSSRAAPPPTVAGSSEQELLDGLLKKLVRSQRLEAAARVSYLAKTFILEDSSGLQKPWSILYTLGALFNAGSAGIQTLDVEGPGSRARADTPESLPELTFSSMDVEKSRLVQKISQPDPDHGLNLVREVLFAAQGIDGRLIQFDPGSSQHKILPSSSNYDTTSNELLFSICELGLLFRMLGNQMETLRTRKPGFVSTAFANAIEAELDGFYRSLAGLEEKVEDRASTMMHSTTLRRVFVWSMEQKETLRSLVEMTTGCISGNTGEMMSCIFKFSKHGDPNIRGLSRRLFAKSCMPIGEILSKWIRDGKLSDPHKEFFIAANDSDDSFEVHLEILPTFISEELARTILTTGKTIHCLRTQCNDSNWLLERKQSDFFADQATHLDFDPTNESNNGVEKVCSRASQSALTRLREVLFTNFRFLHHCANVKKFLLLGQGDFIQGLLEQLAPELDKPVGTILRSTLIRIFESEYMNCASFEDEGDQQTLDHLDIRLFEGSIGDTGWDVFSLDYQITNTPLGIIFTKQIMQTYLRAFKFMWQIRRVDNALGKVWLRQQHRRRTGGLRKDFVANQVLHRGHHLIRSLYNYIVWGVLEESWRKFIRLSRSATTLTELARAHTEFLAEVQERVFLSDDMRDMHKRWIKLMDLLMEFAARTQRTDCVVSDLDVTLRSELKRMTDLIHARSSSNALRSLALSF